MKKDSIFIFFVFLGILGILLSPSLSFEKEEKVNYEDDRFLILNSNSILSPLSVKNPKLKVVKRIDVIITAYASTPGQTMGDPFITASGKKVRWGIVANNLLPLGTKIRIPELFGDEVFIVEDRMNPKKGKKQIDIWFPSNKLAKEFGVKKAYIEVLQ